MESRNEKDLIGVVSADRTLSTLLRAGRMYDELDQRIQPRLSTSLRGHVQVACVDGDCLVLAADSPAWASRARLEAPALLEAARKIWPRELNNWRVIVRQPMN